jgi:hypothetical protein
MDHDIAQKKKYRMSSSPRWNQSKFFHTLSESKTSGVQRRHSDGVMAAGSSKLEDKENVYIIVDDASEPDLDGSDLSLKAQCDYDTDMDLQVDEFPDVVEQEDGYISPTPSCSKDLQDLSSPLRPGQTPARQKWKSDQRLQVDDSAVIRSDEDAYFGVEAVSSPISAVKRRASPFVGRGIIQGTPTKRNTDDDDESCGRILVHATPSPTKVQSPADEISSPILYYGPDLRDALALATDGAADLDYDEPSMNANRQGLRRRKSCPESRYGSTSPPSPSPDTSDSAVLRARQQISEHNVKAVIDVDTSGYDLDEEDIEQARENASRTKVIMNGWRDRWALASKTKKAAQQIPTEEGKTKSISSHGRTVLNQCTPGSGSSRIANFKRSNTNVTPQGRHVLSSASRHPRSSAPFKMAVGGGIKLTNANKGLEKGRRKSISFVTQTRSCAHDRDRKCNREMVDDISMTDAVDDSKYANGVAAMVSGQLDDIALRAQERLSMFR